LPSSNVLVLFVLFASNLKAVSLGRIRRRPALLPGVDDPDSWLMPVLRSLTLGNLLRSRDGPGDRTFSAPVWDASDEYCLFIVARDRS
jgi:hypothetical protein